MAMNPDAVIPSDQDNWLHQVKREWTGPHGVTIREMATGIVRLCIDDKCYAANPNALDVDELIRNLEALGFPLQGGEAR